MPSPSIRRLASAAGATCAAALVLTGAAGPAAAAIRPHTTSTTLSVTLPSTLGNGGDLQPASATIDNSGGHDIQGARVDFDIAPQGSSATLSPADLTLQYEDQDHTYQDIPLTSDGNGGVKGYFGPAAGFSIPAGYTATTPLRVASTTSAPVTGVKVTSNLDTTPGDTSTSIGSAVNTVDLEVPALSLSGFPTALRAGAGYSAFSGTLANDTGSDYSAVRLDFAISSSNAAFTSSDLTLQYCNGGSGAACSGGSFETIPLTGSGSTFSGAFGPQDGFPLPDGADNTTEFRVAVDQGAPATTLSTTVALDDVSSSTGDVTGTVVTTDAATTTVSTATQLSLALPASLGNGGDLRPGSATIDNSTGPAIADARVDFTVKPVTGTEALADDDVVLEYQAAPGVFQRIPLTSDGNGGLTGYFGPQGGFPVPAGYTATTQLEVATNTSAPTGSIRVDAFLDTTPSDTSTAVASDATDVDLAVPSLVFDGFPTTLPGGGSYAGFSGTLANSTGSTYTGGRLDFTITAGTSTFDASQLQLQYCNGATDAACTGGTWTDIPLTGSGTITGYFGPQAGFTLPTGVSNTTQFRVRAANTAAPTGLRTDVAFDKVTTASDVSTGTVVSTLAGTTAVTGVAPRITATVTSAHGRTHFGWYRSPITVTFHCVAGSAPISTCSSPVTLRHNGRNQRVTGTAVAANGQTATVTVKHLNLDRTLPTAHLTGVSQAKRTNKVHYVGCKGYDGLSGIAYCHVSKTRHGHTVRFRISVKDRAGNLRHRSGTLHFPRS